MATIYTRLVKLAFQAFPAKRPKNVPFDQCGESLTCQRWGDGASEVMVDHATSCLRKWQKQNQEQEPVEQNRRNSSNVLISSAFSQSSPSLASPPTFYLPTHVIRQTRWFRRRLQSFTPSKRLLPPRSRWQVVSLHAPKIDPHPTKISTSSPPTQSSKTSLRQSDRHADLRRI